MILQKGFPQLKLSNFESKKFIQYRSTYYTVEVK